MSPGAGYSSNNPYQQQNPFHQGNNPFGSTSNTYSNFQFYGPGNRPGSGAAKMPDMSNIFDDILESFFSGSERSKTRNSSSKTNPQQQSDFHSFFSSSGSSSNRPKPKSKPYQSKQQQSKSSQSSSTSSTSFSGAENENMYAEVIVDCTLEELYTGVIKKLKVTDEIPVRPNTYPPFMKSNILNTKMATTKKISRIIELDVKPGNLLLAVY